MAAFTPHCIPLIQEIQASGLLPPIETRTMTMIAQSWICAVAMTAIEGLIHAIEQGEKIDRADSTPNSVAELRRTMNAMQQWQLPPYHNGLRISDGFYFNYEL